MKTPPIDHSSAVAVVREAIERVAPDVDAAALAPDADIRLEADLDSMDFLAVVEAVFDRTGVAVPEGDYGNVRSIADFAAYLVRATGPPPDDTGGEPTRIGSIDSTD